MGLYRLIIIIFSLVVFDIPSEPVHTDPIVYVEAVKVSDMYIQTLKATKSESITKHLIRACDATKDQKHCINTALGFAGIESSMFRTCKKNNCFGMRELYKPKAGKPYYRVKPFVSINAGIDFRIKNYYEKHLYRIRSGKDAQTTNYCQGVCQEVNSEWSMIIDYYQHYIK